MITDKEIWDEIDSLFVLPERRPNDLDAHDISVHYKISIDAARRKMAKMVASGQYYFEVVKDPTSSQHKRKIIRKVHA